MVGQIELQTAFFQVPHFDQPVETTAHNELAVRGHADNLGVRSVGELNRGTANRGDFVFEKKRFCAVLEEIQALAFEKRSVGFLESEGLLQKSEKTGRRSDGDVGSECAGESLATRFFGFSDGIGFDGIERRLLEPVFHLEVSEGVYEEFEITNFSFRSVFICIKTSHLVSISLAV